MKHCQESKPCCCKFSLQLDETTTSDNNSLLMAYVPYIAEWKYYGRAFISRVFRNGH